MEENETASAADPTAARDALIDKWLADNFHGSIVSRDADVYRHVYAAVQDLKSLLNRSAE
jgi:hypothetical protein